MSNYGEVTGRFVWYDLMTSDVNAAEAFYSKVLGWTTSDSGQPGMRYTLVGVGESMIGGIMPPPPGMEGVHPHWNVYIGVEDVDEYTKKVAAAGGHVFQQPQDIPQVGRFAVVSDPYRARFILFKPIPPPNARVMPDKDAPGSVGWHELHSSDGDKAFEFYTGMFGWTPTSDFDMGPAGKYRMFAAGESSAVGGIMTATGMPYPPMWMLYFTVDGVDAAMERVRTAGGTVRMEPHEVPGGQWIVSCQDPQGALFSLVSYKR